MPETFDHQSVAYRSHIFIAFMTPVLLLSSFFYRDLSIIFFWIQGLLACIYFAKTIKASTHSIFFYIALSCLGFGLYQWVWAELAISSHEFTGAYGNYRNAGKILVCIGVMFFIIPSIALSITKSLRNLHRITLLVGITLIVCCFIEFSFINQFNFQDRISLNLSRATGTAYALSMVFLLSFYSLIFLFRKKYFLHFIYFLLTFICIVLTQTRAAILVYPIITLVFYICEIGISKKTLFATTIALVAMGGSIFAVTQPIVTQRYNDLVEDVQLYEKGNTRTSIGSRLAMDKVGIAASTRDIDTLLCGQSLEKRNEYIRQLVQKNPSLNGVLPYISVHLHNEVIDTLSLKGLFGLFFLTFLYAAFCLTSLRMRSPLCFCLSLSVITFGLSDLIFFSKASVAVLLSLYSAFLLSFTTYLKKTN